jgi:hypothetical protein
MKRRLRSEMLGSTSPRGRISAPRRQIQQQLGKRKSPKQEVARGTTARRTATGQGKRPSSGDPAAQRPRLAPRLSGERPHSHLCCAVLHTCMYVRGQPAHSYSDTMHGVAQMSSTH